MRVFRTFRVASMFVILGAAPLAAQSGAQQMPPMPKPGAEHAVMKMDVGTWDAVVEINAGPGMPAMTSKGVEVNTMGCGGLCLITDFKGQAMGAPFEGHGVMTWDAGKKRYIASWTDSMSMGLAIGESTYDPAAKKWSGTMEGPDMTGNVMKTRSVVENRGATRMMTAYATGPDGKEVQAMKITYTRRK
jgi:hypothetical protein